MCKLLYNMLHKRRALPMQTQSISDVRNELTRYPGRFRKRPEAVEITQRGRPVMALLPWELYESLVETLEVLADEKLTKALRRSLSEIRRGKTYSMEEVEKR